MQLLVLTLLIVLVFISVASGAVWLAFIIGLVLLADLLGGVVSKILGFFYSLITGLVETGKEEAVEIEAAKGKPPSGKKFFGEGFSQAGKGLGKGEKARQEEKENQLFGEKLSVAGVVGGVENFMAGLGKLFRK